MIFEVGVALVLIALFGLLALKFRFSTVPFLILAGIMVGGHAPQFGPIDLQFIQSASIIDFMGKVGVLFLLFYLGLEFSVGRLVKAGRSIAVAGSIHVVNNFMLGMLFGTVMGWPITETLVAAGIMTASSSASIAKTLVDLKRTANPETELILGITMTDDVFLAVYLSLMSGLLVGGSSSLGGALAAGGLALVFMLAILFLGRRAVPLFNRMLNIQSAEVFLLAVLSGLFLVSGLGGVLGIAEGIGALLFGLVLAETEHRQRIEQAILPFRDFFGAFFFFSFGLSIDPRTLGGAVGPAMIAVTLTIVGNFLAGLVSGRSAGLSLRASSYIGPSIVARGEFSIVMANFSAAAGLLGVMQPFAALYVATLALLGPVLAKAAKYFYQGLNRFLQWWQVFRKRVSSAVKKSDS